MKKVILHILVLLISAVSIAAQAVEQKPVLFDELGESSLEDIMARTDALTVALGNDPNSKALIKIYGGRGKYFSSAYWRGTTITAYLRNNVKLPPERYLIEYCNINKEDLRTQLFILPQNLQFPKCDENLNVPTETILFDSVYFYFTKFTFKPLENQYFDVVGAPEGEYSEISLGVLKRLLKESPESKVYIIAYLQTNFETDESGKTVAEKPRSLDKKSLGKRMIQAARKELLNKGFSPAQIVTVDGGYINGNERRLEFWFVPKNGEIPKPKPDYFPKKRRT